MSRLFFALITLSFVLCTLLSSQHHTRSAFIPMEHSVMIAQRNTLEPGRENAQAFIESGSSISIESGFERLVLSGKAERTSFTIEFSFSKPGESSTPWTPAEIRRHPGGRFWTKLMIDTRYSGWTVRYRISDSSSAVPYSLWIGSAEFIGNERSEEDDPIPVPDHTVHTPSDSILFPSMITRAQWGASPPNGIMVPHLPFRAAIHHTATGRVATVEQGYEELKFIQDLHIYGNGWKDIGYHYCIDDSGRVYEGARVQFASSHTDNNNTGNVGIAVLGAYSAAAPTAKAQQACAALLSFLQNHFPIRTDSIFGHRDYVPSTECPGSAFYAVLPALRNSVRRLAAADAPYLKDPLPLPFTSKALPGSSISFSLRDEIEGIQTESLHVSVNNTAIVPAVSVVDEREIKITYTPPAPFNFSSLVTVDVSVYDKALTPHRLEYHYQFRIKAQTIFNELTSEQNLKEGTLIKSGVWTTDQEDAVMTDLTDGVMIYATDSFGDHHLELFPNIKESGNYYISLAFPRQENGINAHYVVKNSNGTAKSECVEYNRNFSLAWYQLGTSAVYFEAGTPSTGSIQLQPLAGMTTLMMLDAVRLEKKDPFLPPDAPELESVRMRDDGAVEIRWFPSLEGGLAGYRVMKSTDGVVWNDTVASENSLSAADTVFAYYPLWVSAALYFKVVAVDTQTVEDVDGNLVHILSEASDVYGASSYLKKKILIVDAFDRIGSWPKLQHPFVVNFGNALSALYGGWETAVNDAIQSGRTDLTDYPIVIYLCGDDSDRDESLSNIEQIRLLRYLEQGGSLFISGSEIAYDLGRAGRPDAALFTSTLKATYGGDDSGVRSCTGIASGPMQGLNFTFGAVTSDTYIEDFPDYIVPSGGSTAILNYQNTSLCAGITYSGLFSGTATAPGTLVYLSFPFETISPMESRSEVMGKIMRNIFHVTGVGDRSVTIPAVTVLEDNFPNPFNPSTTIRYALSPNPSPTGSGDGVRVKLTIHDVLGREIATLVDEEQLPGWKNVTWNAGTSASGIYFYRLQTGNSIETKKMMLLK